MAVVHMAVTSRQGCGRGTHDSYHRQWCRSGTHDSYRKAMVWQWYQSPQGKGVTVPVDLWQSTELVVCPHLLCFGSVGNTCLQPVSSRKYTPPCLPGSKNDPPPATSSPLSIVELAWSTGKTVDGDMAVPTTFWTALSGWPCTGTEKLSHL